MGFKAAKVYRDQRYIYIEFDTNDQGESDCRQCLKQIEGRKIANVYTIRGAEDKKRLRLTPPPLDGFQLGWQAVEYEEKTSRVREHKYLTQQLSSNTDKSFEQSIKHSPQLSSSQTSDMKFKESTSNGDFVSNLDPIPFHSEKLNLKDHQNKIDETIFSRPSEECMIDISLDDSMKIKYAKQDLLAQLIECVFKDFKGRVINGWIRQELNDWVKEKRQHLEETQKKTLEINKINDLREKKSLDQTELVDDNRSIMTLKEEEAMKNRIKDKLSHLASDAQFQLITKVNKPEFIDSKEEKSKVKIESDINSDLSIDPEKKKQKSGDSLIADKRKSMQTYEIDDIDGKKRPKVVGDSKKNHINESYDKHDLIQSKDHHDNNQPLLYNGDILNGSSDSCHTYIKSMKRKEKLNVDERKDQSLPTLSPSKFFDKKFDMKDITSPLSVNKVHLNSIDTNLKTMKKLNNSSKSPSQKPYPVISNNNSPVLLNSPILSKSHLKSKYNHDVDLVMDESPIKGGKESEALFTIHASSTAPSTKEKSIYDFTSDEDNDSLNESNSPITANETESDRPNIDGEKTLSLSQELYKKKNNKRTKTSSAEESLCKEILHEIEEISIDKKHNLDMMEEQDSLIEKEDQEEKKSKKKSNTQIDSENLNKKNKLYKKNKKYSVSGTELYKQYCNLFDRFSSVDEDFEEKDLCCPKFQDWFSSYNQLWLQESSNLLNFVNCMKLDKPLLISGDDEDKYYIRLAIEWWKKKVIQPTLKGPNATGNFLIFR